MKRETHSYSKECRQQLVHAQHLRGGRGNAQPSNNLPMSKFVKQMKLVIKLIQQKM